MPNVIKFRIELTESSPKIWREFLVEDGITFARFHEIVQIVMGWENCHLYSFERNRIRIEMEEFNEDNDYLSAEKTKLKDFIKKEGEVIDYLYDFGDSWKHTILVQKIEKNKKTNPKCLAGKMRCPPEDSGGLYSYEDYLERAKKDELTEEEEEYGFLGGEDFDPEFFNTAVVNASLIMNQKDNT
ncbi:MAG: plasmid pRiA4b ORF-3 family protein [Alphaproteobacteria bacterium]